MRRRRQTTPPRLSPEVERRIERITALVIGIYAIIAFTRLLEA